MLKTNNVQELIGLLTRYMEIVDNMEFELRDPDWQYRLKGAEEALENEMVEEMAQKREAGWEVAMEVLKENARTYGEACLMGPAQRYGVSKMLADAIGHVLRMGNAGALDEYCSSRHAHLIDVQDAIREQCVDWDRNHYWQRFASYWPRTNDTIF
jgi:hypothetical protein